MRLLVFFCLLLASPGFGQPRPRYLVEKLMYDSVRRHNPDTLLVFHDYNAHFFAGYDECTRYVDLRYGFRHQYHGRVARIGFPVLKYDWLNRRWSRQMRRRHGPGWSEAYHRERQACAEQAVFRRFGPGVPDTTQARIRGLRSKAALLRVPPVQFLAALRPEVHHYLRTPAGKDTLAEQRRDVKFQVRAQDNWVKKADVAELMPYLYAEQTPAVRACLCADTVQLGPSSSVALEAYKLIMLYRGHDYPASFPSVSRAELDALFAWWLEERKRP